MKTFAQYIYEMSKQPKDDETVKTLTKNFNAMFNKMSAKAKELHAKGDKRGAKEAFDAAERAMNNLRLVRPPVRDESDPQ